MKKLTLLATLILCVATSFAGPAVRVQMVDKNNADLPTKVPEFTGKPKITIRDGYVAYEIVDPKDSATELQYNADFDGKLTSVHCIVRDVTVFFWSQDLTLSDLTNTKKTDEKVLERLRAKFEKMKLPALTVETSNTEEGYPGIRGGGKIETTFTLRGSSDDGKHYVLDSNHGDYIIVAKSEFFLAIPDSYRNKVSFSIARKMGKFIPLVKIGDQWMAPISDYYPSPKVEVIGLNKKD
jgi:hypothetical protein